MKNSPEHACTRCPEYKDTLGPRHDGEELIIVAATDFNFNNVIVSAVSDVSALIVLYWARRLKYLTKLRVHAHVSFFLDAN